MILNNIFILTNVYGIWEDIEMVYVFLAEGFEEVEALTAVDVLRRAGVEVKSVLVPAGDCGGRVVIGAHGISVNADIYFDEADFDACEMIVLPGGMPGTLNLAKHAGLAEQIRHFAEGAVENEAGASGGAGTKYLAAICAAPMIPGEMGLFDGKMATIYPGMEEHLKGALLMKNRVVVDGNIVTSKGPGTAMEFAVELAAILKGKETAESLMEDLLMGR